MYGSDYRNLSLWRSHISGSVKQKFEIVSNVKQGDYYTKNITVKNTGILDSSYNLTWTELTNEITNNELVIETTYKQLNSNNEEEGICESIVETSVKSTRLVKNISLYSLYTMNTLPK